MENPNQEEVRSQGSEVVHFIDQVLSTSYSLNAMQSQTLDSVAVPSTDQGKEFGFQTSKGLRTADKGGGGRGSASQWGTGEGAKAGCQASHPEALPGLTSPLLPPLRFTVVHSETGLDSAGQWGGIKQTVPSLLPAPPHPRA